MGDINKDSKSEDDVKKEVTGETWALGAGDGTWQNLCPDLKSRISNLHNSSQMSDVNLLACDENWWFGETVKDFSTHKFVLAMSSPVLHHLFYELDEENNPERRLLLNQHLEINLSLTKCFDYEKLEMDGVPPVVVSALLDYMYRDKFEEKDFEQGYSRNLLWRLWHVSTALEMGDLCEKTCKTLEKTICEDSIFWDLNYALKFNMLGTNDIMSKVLKVVDNMGNKLFEDPNFVWLEKDALHKLLSAKETSCCDPLVIYNNLLRWCLYQLDRTACSEINGKTGADIPVEFRIEWIRDFRAGKYPHIDEDDFNKYLNRAMAYMPWTELSQKDFLEYVVPYNVLPENELLKQSLVVMETVVKNPDRLHHSAFSSQASSKKSSLPPSPCVPRKAISRTNSMRQSMKEGRNEKG